MKTVIMAGGYGTRLKPVTKKMVKAYPGIYNNAEDICKPLALIDGVPILEREINCLVSQGLDDIILTVSHCADVVMDYFGDGSGISRATGKHFDCKISYFVENEPLGNAGALFILKDQLDEDFLLLNADSIFDIDFNRMIDFHKACDALVTLFVHPNTHPYDSGLIIRDRNNVVKSWLTKEDERPEYYNNCVNAGIHILSSNVLSLATEISNIDVLHIGNKDDVNNTVKIDLDRQILKPLVKTNRIFAYDSPEYVKDIGTPERFEAVTHDYNRGIISMRNLKHSQKAIFLDRDGVINRYTGFLTNIEDFDLVPGIDDFIKKINESGYLAIVITNQPVIARGDVTVEQLNDIHKKMETLLGQKGCYIDGLYYCPHHPEKGFKGEIPELKIECDCRKPKTGLIQKASDDFNIDISSSYMIGDSKSDIVCGENAGVKGTVLYTGEGSYSNSFKDIATEIDIIPDFIVNDLNIFLDKIGIPFMAE